MKLKILKISMIILLVSAVGFFPFFDEIKNPVSDAMRKFMDFMSGGAASEIIPLAGHTLECEAASPALALKEISEPITSRASVFAANAANTSDDSNTQNGTQPRTVLIDAPFVPQAPFGDWNDPVQADACEETSALIAMYWATGQKLSREDALREIMAMAEFETALDGEYRDRSITDTAELIRSYFGYDKLRVMTSIKGDDIIKELSAGRLVITTVNGQMLNNPHYRGAGPINHMLVVTGYDAETDEFIVNDPGTQFGEGNRYSRELFEKSLKDYPTGYHDQFDEKRTGLISFEKT